MKNIKEYQGLYAITKEGKVWSYPKKWAKTGHNGKFLKWAKQGKYFFVPLHKQGKVKNHYIHRLVATTFIQNPKKKGFVNHIDFNTGNNSIENLEWVTSKENIAHSRKHGHYSEERFKRRKGENSHLSKLKNGKVLEIRRLFLKGNSTVLLSKKFKVTRMNIYHIISRKSWKHI